MTTKREIENYDVEQLCDYLIKLGYLSEETVASICQNRISGVIFFELGDDDLREIAPTLGNRKVLQKLIRSYAPTPQTTMVSILKVRDTWGKERFV